MSYLHAVILGIIQGLTEFLPVSSSGHLVLVQHLFTMGEGLLTFDIFLHFGSLMAVLLVFRHRILRLLFFFTGGVQSLVTDRNRYREVYRKSQEYDLFLALVIGTVPAVFAGFLLKDAVESLFSSLLPVLLALAGTGCVLIATFFAREQGHTIKPLHGMIVGIAQAVAVVPGISRSGMTISAALFSGVRRSEAGEFSFLLSIPVIAGAAVLALFDAMDAGLTSVPWGPVVAGMLAAFISGWVSLVLLMGIIRRGALGYFGIYCLALSLSGLFFLHGPAATQRQRGESEMKGLNTPHKEKMMDVREVSIQSSHDGALQKLKYLKANQRKRPLIVALHTWSFDYSQDAAQDYFTRCYERDWNCIFPDFRGPNNNPQAGGSEAALKDILDAVSWAFENMSVDHRRIFLVGASGGGHMALLCAGTLPSTWTAVSAWIPISDLTRWHKESVERGLKYSQDVEQICGGPPGASPEVDEQYAGRSPVTSLWRAHIIPVDINAGIHDGHAGIGGEGSVPVGHSIRAYNELAKASQKPGDVIPEDIISSIEREERIPEGFERRTIVDPVYGREIHLRRVSSLARLTLFEGGHEILYDAAFEWFEKF